MRPRQPPAPVAMNEKRPRNPRALQAWFVCDGLVLGRVAQQRELRLALQALKRPGLGLARVGHAHAELAGRLLDRVLALATGTVAQVDDLHLLGRQLLQEAADAPGVVCPDDVHLDVGVLDGDQRTQRGLAVLADAGVKRRERALVAAQALDLLDVEAGRIGQLLQRGILLQLHRQLTLDAGQLAGALRHVRRQADRAAGVVQAALQRLTDPDRRVRREAEALAPIELLGRPDQSEHALLDQIAHGQALALVLARHVDDEAQVRIDEALLGGQIAALDALGELDLLTGTEQRVARGATQQVVQWIGVRDRYGVQRSPSIPTLAVGIISHLGCLRNLLRARVGVRAKTRTPEGAGGYGRSRPPDFDTRIARPGTIGP